MDRLTRATYTSLGSAYEQFNYDLLGNRGGNSPAGTTGYQDTRTGGATITYAENNPANEYASIGSTTVTYDAAGNLTKDEDGYAVHYDAEGQLDLIYLDLNLNGSYDGTPTDKPVGEYKYDALGRRIEFINRFDGSGIYICTPTPCAVTSTTRYVYDRQNVVAEYNDASVRQRYYVHGTSYIDGRALIRDETETPSKDYYYLLKDLYTVVGLVNKQGKEVERYTYDAYGRAAVTAILTGDVFPDGRVDGTDRSAWNSAYTANDPNPADPCISGSIFDINGDGAINFTDRSLIVSQWTAADGTPGANLNQTISASAIGNPYHFTGRTRDVFKDAIAGTPGAKQIYHYRARYYDPEHGRFLQRDSAEYKDGPNLYEYVRSRPTRDGDPSGLSCGAGMGAAGGGTWDDRTKACCKYTRLRDSGETSEFETMLFGKRPDSLVRRFQRVEKCSGGEATPEDCCDCPGVKRGRWAHVRLVTRLDKAHWGECCWCTVVLKYPARSPGYPWGHWHGYLIAYCRGKTISVEIIPWQRDWFSKMFPYKGELNWQKYEPNRLVPDSTCRIDCETADRFIASWKDGRYRPYDTLDGSNRWPRAEFESMCREGYKPEKR